uniref:Uncharacterized protein n=1 Tax=Xanthomonas citri pv. viticola TaxID=487899 RepID=A0A088FN23_XANCI|nr:hypothetical protein [Xanthomonas citri pv. viticola]
MSSTTPPSGMTSSQRTRPHSTRRCVPFGMRASTPSLVHPAASINRSAA